MQLNKLSAAKVKALSKPGRYGDGGGLWLQVSKWNTKAWLFRYTLDGRSRQMGLGSIHTLSLAAAREKAQRSRALLLEGIDPIEAKHGERAAARAEAAKRITFRESAERYIAAHRAGWKNEKHGEQWRRTLETYAFPVVGSIAVADVSTAHVIKVLEPIWEAKTETASRVRGRMEAVLDWARARHFREGDNPARWRGHLDKLLPAKTKVRKVKHHDAMPYGELAGFMAELDENDSISARALEFTILTAARTSETIGARWPEVDLETKIWTVPGKRTKSGREHRVPLSARALDVLRALPKERGNRHIFIGATKRCGLSNMTMLKLLRGMTDNGYTVHGFRSTFRDWCGERTNQLYAKQQI